MLCIVCSVYVVGLDYRVEFKHFAKILHCVFESLISK